MSLQVNRRALLRIVPAGLVLPVLPLLAEDKKVDPSIVEMSTDIVVPAANRILAYRGTKADVNAITAAYKGFANHLMSVGVDLTLPDESRVDWGKTESRRRDFAKAGLTMESAHYQQHVADVNYKYKHGLKDRCRDQSVTSLHANMLLSLRQAAQKMPDTAGDASIKNAQWFDCCSTDWGGSYIGVVSLAIEGPVGIGIGIVAVAIWGIGKIAGC